ncbi:MAG: phosphoribosylformylglycinamidine cyclo-ligase, partial [Perlabentimonas sp.]
QAQSNTPWEEMYKVFNMGHRYEIYVFPEYAEDIVAIAKEFGIDAQIIGSCHRRDKGNKLIIKSEAGNFSY